MKTLLLTEVDFARLKALLASSELPSEIAALPSLQYCLTRDIPAFPPLDDIYNALRSATGNTSDGVWTNLLEGQLCAGEGLPPISELEAACDLRYSAPAEGCLPGGEQ